MVTLKVKVKRGRGWCSAEVAELGLRCTADTEDEAREAIAAEVAFVADGGEPCSQRMAGLLSDGYALEFE